MIKAIIFDFDGTIAPTNLRQYQWFQYWAKENNKELLFKDYDPFMNFYNEEHNKKGIQSIYDVLELPCDMNDRNHPVHEAYEEFKANNPSGLYEGIESALHAIWEMGHLTGNIENNKRIRLAINSSNTWKSIKKDLEKYNLLQLFDCFVTEEVLRKHCHDGNLKKIQKPSTKPLELILGFLGSNASETMHFGDTIYDLIASRGIPGKNGGDLIAVGTAWGYEGEERLKVGASINGKHLSFDEIIMAPKDCMEIVKKYL
ncbi:MAG: HAD hydrolase-like protein [Nanoarchaeota archaeon]|nr:HAD hydrolase-like protein [Nanoarchaeota archaeon]